MIPNIFTIILFVIFGMMMAFYGSGLIENLYIPLLFLAATVISSIYQSVSKKSANQAFIFGNPAENIVMLEGETEIKKIIHPDSPEKSFLSWSKKYVQDVIITDKRVILLGSNFMKSRNLPQSVFYKEDDYRKFGNQFSFLLNKIEKKNEKTCLYAKQGIFTYDWTIKDKEVFDLINKYRS